MYLFNFTNINVCHVLMQQIDEYLKGCRFLPKLNNEKAEERNSTYKKRFSSLENLVLIMVVALLSGIFPSSNFKQILVIIE